MAITLSDIAKYCGKDISTVSRALRDDNRVKPATREQIKKAAAELGYSPNLAARSLKVGKTKTIWFLAPTLGNPLEREPAEAASQYLYESGYDLMVGMHHSDDTTYKRLIRRLLSGGADGAIIIPGSLDPAMYGQLVKNNYPLVFLDRHPESLSVPVVTTDNKNAAAELVRLCAAQQVQSCISLFGDGNAVERSRRDGALAELGKHQIPVLLPEEGRLTPEIADRLPQRIAVVCTQQKPLRNFLAENRKVLQDKTLFFGVFDGWNGEPHPAEEAYSCIQDFTTMAHLASDRILGLISNKDVSGDLIDLVPPKEFQTVTRTF